MPNYKSITGTTELNNSTGEHQMRLWIVLVESKIQDVTIRGTVHAHAMSQESAERLAVNTTINGLRQLGVWAETTEVEETFEIESDKKDDKGQLIMENETRKVTKYMAPYYNHVQAVDILDNNDYSLSYSDEELEEANVVRKYIKSNSTKRRTSGQVALAERKKKQKQLEQKEEKQVKEEARKKNDLKKEEVFAKVLQYFSGEPKKIKDASNDLEIQYQKVRYALFLIRAKGYNNQSFELKETEIDESKAFQLIQKD